MIRIEQPKLTTDNETATLEVYINIDNKREKIWFQVEKKFEQYLCYERSDAFLIAVLNFAMRNKHDIVCEAPITEELYYNIDKYLIDAIASYNPHFYRTKIIAPIATDSLPCAGAVGTGISCGVDSLHALANQTNLKFKNHNITHLTFNNVGSHGEGNHAKQLYKERLSIPKKFAEEYGFEFVPSNSNLMDVIKQSHFKTHTYSSMFAVYCLQKLYSVYYYASSGYRYHEFTLIDKSYNSCGSYEILSLPLLSTKNLRIYSEGEGLSRLMKLKDVVNYPPSYKYLNVCLKESKNCGTCEKCVRTLLGIDALGKLDKYNEVFNIEYYKQHKQWYLKQLLRQMAMCKHDYFELYPYFKKEITLMTRIKAFRLGDLIPRPIKNTQFYKKLRASLIR